MKIHHESQDNIQNIVKLAKFARDAVTYSVNICINFLVPPRCVNCNQLSARQTGICASCWKEMRFIERPFCEVMGTPFSVHLGEGTLSTQAIADPPPFNRLRSAVLYDDIARQLISRFKFSDRNDLAPFIANVMARAGKELIEEAELIVPLPLHRRRLHARRFNQSAELARIISTWPAAASKPIAFDPMALSRVRNTRQQIGLTQEARRRNVSGAFVVPTSKRPLIKDKKILLIDDVYTSGASVKSATKALLRGGADSVDVLTFARVHSGVV